MISDGVWFSEDRVHDFFEALMKTKLERLAMGSDSFMDSSTTSFKILVNKLWMIDDLVGFSYDQVHAFFKSINDENRF